MGKKMETIKFTLTLCFIGNPYGIHEPTGGWRGEMEAGTLLTNHSTLAPRAL